MGRIVKFWALLLVVTVAVQHIQIERIKNIERERWRQLCIEMDVKRADAAAPVVAVGLAAAAPFLLAALVAGTVAYWCWSHGGKESLVQLVKATKNGVAVTKDWVQRQIAELHGIDTESGPFIDFTFFEAEGIDHQSAIGKYFRDPSTGHVRELVSFHSYYPLVGIGPYITYSLYGDILTFFTGHVSGAHGHPEGYYSGQAHKYNTRLLSPAEAQAISNGFNPADHPHLWVGPGLLTDCHKVMEKNPDIELWVLPVPERPANAPDSAITTISLAAKLSDGSLVDTDGRKWMAPFPPPPLSLPTLEDGKVAAVSVAPPKDNKIYPPVALPGDVIIPKPVADELGHYVPVGAQIKGLTHIGGNVANPALEWVNEAGETIVTPIPQSLAGQLAGSIPLAASAAAAGTVGGTSSTTTTAVIHPNMPERDPGNPADIPLPDVPIFDPEMDWGEEEPWPWESWISSLPFIDVLKSSSINLSGATSVISCNITFLGKSKTISYDFSEWNWLLNSMGILIYACACWYALQLALLKRD